MTGGDHGIIEPERGDIGDPGSEGIYPDGWIEDSILIGGSGLGGSDRGP